MLKSCGRKLLLSLVGSMFTCLLVLMVEPPGRPGLARGEAGGAQRALQSLGAARAAGQGAPGLRSFADYFGRLSRARRELPAAPPSPPRPPAEDITPRDVFIAVKTTKKFHKARLELLLDTWISRNRDMVRSRPAGANGTAPLLPPLCAPSGSQGGFEAGLVAVGGGGEMRGGCGKRERRKELTERSDPQNSELGGPAEGPRLELLSPGETEAPLGAAHPPLPPGPCQELGSTGSSGSG